jgi:hypothetical protein
MTESGVGKRVWVAMGLTLFALLFFAPSGEGATLLQKILKISGIAANPTGLRGSSTVAGEIWITDQDMRNPRLLAGDAAYRTPIFTDDDSVVLALRDETLVRIPLRGSPVALATVQGVEKLVGIDEAGFVLVTMKDAGVPPLALLSPSDGVLEPLPRPQTPKERLLVEEARGDIRTYGAIVLSVGVVQRKTMAGNIEWIDVFARTGADTAKNITECDGANCGQPSLSANGNRVVYVREQPR